MLFSNTLTQFDIADIHMNGIKIDYSSSLRFLGVISGGVTEIKGQLFLAQITIHFFNIMINLIQTSILSYHLLKSLHK